MSYQFKDKGCWRLWEAASPKGDRHLAAFAWRESPAGLERAWTKACQGKDDIDRDALLSECLAAGESQSAYRRAQLRAGEKLCRPPGIAVWVNKGGWAEETVDPGDSRPEQRKVINCKYCDDPATHGEYGTCNKHTPIHEDQAWRELMVRARMRQLMAWRDEHKEEGESDSKFFTRIARWKWSKIKERLEAKQ